MKRVSFSIFPAATKTLLPVVLVLLSACSTRKAPKTFGLIIYPPPPSPPRIQYLTSLSKASDVTGGRSSFMEYVAGKEAEKEIIKPYGIAVDKGRIYVCDTILGGLEVLDLGKKTFSYFQPSGRGQLKKPINIFKEPGGSLYVADAGRGQIVVFDDNLHYITAFGENDLKKPTDVFVAGDLIYVADIKLQKVAVYSKKDYQPVDVIPGFEYSDEETLFSPTNVAVKGERIYVTDFGDFKIKIYSRKGEFISSVGSYGKALGQFVRPKGIAIDDDHNLYVVDAGFENIQIFDKEGQLLLFFGGSYKGPGGMWLPAKVVLDRQNTDLFSKYVDKRFELKYLIFVTNQYGPDKINVYGFISQKENLPDDKSKNL